MKAILIVAMLVAATAALAADAPGARAHKCTAEEPARSCGDCKEVWYRREEHNHTYTDGRNYCRSTEADCDAADQPLAIASRSATGCALLP